MRPRADHCHMMDTAGEMASRMQSVPKAIGPESPWKAAGETPQKKADEAGG